MQLIKANPFFLTIHFIRNGLEKKEAYRLKLTERKMSADRNDKKWTNPLHFGLVIV